MPEPSQEQLQGFLLSKLLNTPEMKEATKAAQEYGNATKKMTAEQAAGLRMLNMTDEEYKRMSVTLANHVYAVTRSDDAYLKTLYTLEQGRGKWDDAARKIATGSDTIQSAGDKFKETMSSIAKEMNLSGIAMGAAMIGLGTQMEKWVLDSRKAAYAIAPSGIAGAQQGLDVGSNIVQNFMPQMRALGLTTEESSKRIQESAIAGARAGHAFEDITERVKAARIAEVLYNINSETASKFQDLVGVRLGLSANTASVELSRLMKDFNRTGLSTEMYGKTMNALLSSSAAYGSNLGELSMWTKLLAPDLKNQRIAVSDVVSALTNLRDASAGTQMGIVALAQQYGVAGRLSGVSPLGAPGAIMGEDTSGAQLLVMQVELARKLSDDTARGNGITDTNEKRTIDLLIGQSVMPGLSQQMVSKLMNIDRTSDKFWEAIEEVNNTIKALSPEEQDKLARETVRNTTTMAGNIAIIKDMQLLQVASQMQAGALQVGGFMGPVLDKLLGKTIATPVIAAFEGAMLLATLGKKEQEKLGGATMIPEKGTSPFFFNIPAFRPEYNTTVNVPVEVKETRTKEEEKDWFDNLIESVKKSLVTEGVLSKGT